MDEIHRNRRRCGRSVGQLYLRPHGWWFELHPRDARRHEGQADTCGESAGGYTVELNSIWHLAAHARAGNDVRA